MVENGRSEDEKSSGVIGNRSRGVGTSLFKRSKVKEDLTAHVRHPKPGSTLRVKHKAVKEIYPESGEIGTSCRRTPGEPGSSLE